MFHYIKYLLYFVTVLGGIASLLFAQDYIYLGALCFVAYYVLGDIFLGDDKSTPTMRHTGLLNIMLYASLPITLLLIISIVWLFSAGNWPFMTVMSQWLSYDFLAAKAQTSNLQLFIAILFTGLMLSGVATVVAHELVHKVGKPIAVCCGRWLLSLSFDANFSIEHVYNHHVHVGTDKDPVTAPRGRNVYTHLVIAIIKTNQCAWAIEKKRLNRLGLSPITIHNRYLRGHAMSLVYLAIVYGFAGWFGMLAALMVGITAKIILEIVNYMEHYGLVRAPRRPVEPKHSWNNNRRISCWTMFNLPRHSHHHAQANLSFEKLKPMPDAPVMIGGYISTMALTLIPPLWYYLMQDKLAEWDRKHASAEELTILQNQALPPSKLSIIFRDIMHKKILSD